MHTTPITDTTLDGVIDYLATRPWAEVNGLLTAIQGEFLTHKQAEQAAADAAKKASAEAKKGKK